MSDKTLIGWGELKIGSTVVAQGKASWNRSVQTVERRAPYGPSIMVTDSVDTAIDETMKVTVDELSDDVVCLLSGLDLSSDVTTAQAVGTSYPEHTNVTFELFDRRNPTTAMLTRAGFSAKIIPDGDLATAKETFSEITLNIKVTGTFGTIKFTPRS